MLFLELYNLIFESDFSELPENAPYGFWIYPSGEFSIVNGQRNHAQIAQEIINDLFPPNTKYSNPNIFLLNNGFMRCVSDEYTQSLFFDRDTVSPSSQQMRTLKDLAIFYNLTARRD